MESCTRVQGSFEGATVTMFVPSGGESGLKFRLRQGAFSLDFTLNRVPERDEPRASANVSLLWRQPGDGLHSDIWASDGLVFAPGFTGGVEILDAASGEILGSASVVGAAGGGPYAVLDVKVRDGLLYAATVSNGLVVFDVSEPAKPELIGQYHVFLGEGSSENFTNIHNIFLSPDRSLVYAINHSFPEEQSGPSGPNTELRVIDVSDPTAPVEAGRFLVANGNGVVHDINVIQRDGELVAFLNDLVTGFWVLDVTDPASIQVMGSLRWSGTLSHSGWPFALGDRLYYAHAEEGYDRHLTVLDVTDLADPKVVSRFSTRLGISIHNVQVVEGIAYISYYIDGLRVVDLRDPEDPEEIAHYDTVPEEDERDILQGAWGVVVVDGVAYVSDMEGGTFAIQVDPEG